MVRWVVKNYNGKRGNLTPDNEIRRAEANYGKLRLCQCVSAGGNLFFTVICRATPVESAETVG